MKGCDLSCGNSLFRNSVLIFSFLVTSNTNITTVPGQFMLS